jgi:hypothetical protein
MLWKLIALPFRIVGFVLKGLGKTGKFIFTSMLGTLIVATIGFLLGMKYMEYQRERDKQK